MLVHTLPMDESLSINPIFLNHMNAIESTNQCYWLDTWDLTSNFQEIQNPSLAPAIDLVLTKHVTYYT